MQRSDEFGGFSVPALERKSVKQKSREYWIDFKDFLIHDWYGNRWGKKVGQGFDRLTRTHLSVIVVWAYFELSLFRSESGFGEFFSGLMLGIALVVCVFAIFVTLHFLHLFLYRFLLGALLWRYPLYQKNTEEKSNMVGIPPSGRVESDQESDDYVDIPMETPEDAEQNPEEMTQDERFNEAIEAARAALDAEEEVADARKEVEVESQPMEEQGELLVEVDDGVD